MSSDIEIRARRWLSELPIPVVVRALAWVPFLVTPPLAAIAIAFYMRRRGRVLPANEERHLRDSVFVAIINIIASIMFLYSFGHFVLDALMLGMNGFFDFFRRFSEVGEKVLEV